MDIILYLLQLIQQLYQQNCFLINFICKYIPLKQWAFDDSHSPKYQKFKIDQLPLILNIEPWNYLDYIAYLKWRYKDQFKPIKPVAAVPMRHRQAVSVPAAMHRAFISTKTMVQKVSLCVKYAVPSFAERKPLFLIKTALSSLYAYARSQEKPEAFHCP